MRILVISNLYPPNARGGYEIACANVARELSQRGHEVLVLTAYCLESLDNDNETNAGPKVLRILNYYPESASCLKYISNILKSQYFSWKNYRIMKQYILSFLPEIIYVWNITGIGMFTVVYITTKFHNTVIFHLMDYELARNFSLRPEGSKKFMRWFRKVIFLNCHKLFNKIYFIAMSENVKQAFVSSGYNHNRIVRIYHGLSLENYQCKNLDQVFSDKIKFLYCGQIVKEKGLDVLIQALVEVEREIRDFDFKLDIFGKGDSNYLNALRGLIKSLDLQDDIKINDFKTNKEIAKMFHAYDIFVYPTLRNEPFGIAIIEAMAAGLPTIATDIGGVREIITHGETGFLFPKEDFEVLSRIIIQLLRNKELYRKISSNAVDDVKKRFVLNRSVTNIEDFFSECLSSKV